MFHISRATSSLSHFLLLSLLSVCLPLCLTSSLSHLLFSSHSQILTFSHSHFLTLALSQFSTLCRAFLHSPSCFKKNSTQFLSFLLFPQFLSLPFPFLPLPLSSSHFFSLPVTSHFPFIFSSPSPYLSVTILSPVFDHPLTNAHMAPTSVPPIFHVLSTQNICFSRPPQTTVTPVHHIPTQFSFPSSIQP